MTDIQNQHQNFDQIVQMGEHVARVIGSPAFQMAYQKVLNELQRQMFDCEAGHVESLKELRRQGNALGSVMNMFKRYVDEAHIVLQQQENNRPVDPNAPDPNQGFGQMPYDQ